MMPDPQMSNQAAAAFYGEGWRSIDTMPMGTTVEVLTVKGLIREARRKTLVTVRRADKWGPRRLHVWRADRSADLMAVAWRPKGDRPR